MSRDRKQEEGNTLIYRSKTQSEFKTLTDILKYRAHFEPEKQAYRFIIQEGQIETLNYGELYHRAAQLGALIQEKTQPLDRILLAAQPGLEFIIGFLACLLTRTIAVPIFPPANAAMTNRFLHVLENAQPSLLLCDKKTAKTMRHAQTANRFIPGKMRQLLGISENQSLILNNLDKFGLTFINIEDSNKYTYNELQFPDIFTEDVAFLQYTSGSTKTPRGVMLSHANLLDNLSIIHKACHYTPDCHLFSWLPPYHDMGLIAGILSPLYEGMEVTLMSTLDFIARPARWVTYMSQFQCTRTGGPNFAYELCARKTPAEIIPELKLSQLEAAANGAEPLNIETLRLFYTKFAPAGLRKGAMLPCYGLAESTVMCTAKPFMTDEKILYVDPILFKKNKIEPVAEHAQAKQLVSSGVPLMEVKIVNPDTSELASPDEVGEIWLHGASVSSGYFNNPEETTKVFKNTLKNDPLHKQYLRTGDLGFFYEQQLFICGRLKQLIILNGQNFYPQDIEFIAERASPHIRIGCTVAFPVTLNDKETLALAVEVHPNTASADYKLIIDEIQNSLFHKLQIHAQSIYLLPPKSIPKTTSGKLERNRCKELIEQESIKPIYHFVQQQSSKPDLVKKNNKSWIEILAHTPEQQRKNILQQLLINLTEEILDTGEKLVDLQKGFFEYGFDSIKAAQLKEAVEEACEYQLSLDSSLVFNYPNVGAISEYLLERLGYENPVLTPTPSSRTSKSNEEEIAVVGMSAIVPGAQNIEEFWELLLQKQTAIQEIPSSRWDVNQYYDEKPAAPGKMSTRYGGFIKDIEAFDALFFAINPKAAAYLDPQQRMLLQQTWHALEDAAIPPHALRGSNTGIFIGISSHDYETLILKNLDDNAINRHVAIGNSASVAAGRLSYFLGLEGPNMAIDTACSSSLVALHQACEHLRRRDCELAIAGGVNAILSPYLFINFSKAGMLAADGRCKTFDAAANGYVRGEGCGIVVLKRLSDAINDNNVVHAVIKSSAYNQDGASSGLTVPNGRAQKKLLQQVLNKSGLSPADVGYIECHGTGTSLGDPIEVNTIVDIYEGLRAEPLRLGSVKTNIGHLEAAAGVAGVIKTILTLKHQFIPATLNFKDLNPRITLKGQIEIASDNVLPTHPLQYAAVSSFGFSGTNAHMIISRAPVTETPIRQSIHASSYLFLISAKSEHSLKQLIINYQDFLHRANDEMLEDICFTQALGREHLRYRIALLIRNKEELKQALAQNNFKIHEVQEGDEILCPLSAQEALDAYLTGKKIDWSRLYGASEGQYAHSLVSLPQYTFQKDSYWLPLP
ncbi:MAG: AMP-binding protein [Legionella sp.]|nr:AMP-binding protein [Legionella sp.]